MRVKASCGIMRGFELTKAFENTVIKAADHYQGPRQIIWGVRDHALTGSHALITVSMQKKCFAARV